MSIDQYRTDPMAPAPRNGWRVLSKFRAFLLWFGGFHLGANLAVIAWGAADGKTWTEMMAPILGCIVAILFVVQALWWSPRPENYISPED